MYFKLSVPLMHFNFIDNIGIEGQPGVSEVGRHRPQRFVGRGHSLMDDEGDVVGCCWILLFSHGASSFVFPLSGCLARILGCYCKALDITASYVQPCSAGGGGGNDGSGLIAVSVALVAIVVASTLIEVVVIVDHASKYFLMWLMALENNLLFTT